MSRCNTSEVCGGWCDVVSSCSQTSRSTAQSAKRQQFMKLLAQGSTLAATRREVGVSRSTGPQLAQRHAVRLKDGNAVRAPWSP